MGILLSDHEKKIFQFAKNYALENITPFAAEWDAAGEIPESAIDDLRNKGFFGINSPASVGGKNYSYLETALTYEGLAHGDPGVAFFVQLQNNITFEYATFWNVSNEIKALVPDLVSAKYLTSFAISETEAGSDPSMGKSYAVLKEDGYHIFGEKTWISNCKNAKYFNITLKDGSPKGMIMLLVDRDTPGFEVVENLRRIGGNSMSCGTIRFNDCVVPKSMFITDHAFREALKCIDLARIMVPAICVGLSQRALDITKEYLAKRKTFGQPIIKNQGVQWRLAELEAKVEAARWLVYHTASVADSGEKVGTIAATAKLVVPDIAMEVTTECAQYFGANGCNPYSEIIRLFNMAKIAKVVDGTSEVCKIVLGRNIEKETLEALGDR